MEMREIVKIIEENGLQLHGDIEHFVYLIEEQIREACNRELQWYYETGDEDVRAMGEAQIVLQAIKDTEPGIYDEMIDNALRLIHNALVNQYFKHLV